MCAADIDDENLSLHERSLPEYSGELSVAPTEAAKTLKEAPLLWFCRRAGRPAIDYFKGEKTKQQLPGRFQIEPQILGNLLHRSRAIELGGESGLV
jgi:hypothetical protein